MNEPFRVPVRTRGYECDATRTVPARVLLSYLEHLRWECMQDPRLGVVEAVHQGHFFVVVEQRIELVRQVGMGVDLQVWAALEQVGRSTGWVRHVITSPSGVVALARVRGAWIGPHRRLARIPDRMREVAQGQAGLPLPEPVPSEGIEDSGPSWFEPPVQTWASRGLNLDPPATVDAPVVHTHVVRPSDLDIFEHVNASRYLALLDDARQRMDALGAVRRLAIRHPQEARLGDTLVIRGHRQGDRLAFSFSRDQDLLCTAALELA